MATLTICNVPGELVDRIKRFAERKGISMEQEIRCCKVAILGHRAFAPSLSERLAQHATSEKPGSNKNENDSAAGGKMCLDETAYIFRYTKL